METGGWPIGNAAGLRREARAAEIGGGILGKPATQVEGPRRIIFVAAWRPWTLIFEWRKCFLLRTLGIETLRVAPPWYGVHKRSNDPFGAITKAARK